MQSPPQPPPDELVIQYLLGTLSGEDAEHVRNTLQASPSLRGRIAGLRAAFQGDDIIPRPSVDASLATLHVRRLRLEHEVANRFDANDSRAASQPTTRIKPRVAKSPTSRWILGGGISLALVGLFIVAGISTHWNGSPARTYTTGTAQRATVLLRDGTRIMLAPQSRLSIARGYDKSARTIALTGEAFFEVHAHAEHPFLVRTGAITTRVLGTSFAVRRYTGEETTRVSVVSGRVSTEGTRASVRVNAGTAASVTDSTAVLVAQDGAGTHVEWPEGRLIFKDTPIPTVLTEVGRWYGYEFRLNDPTLASRNLSATFKVSDAQEMLLTLQVVLNVSMTFDGRVVVLSPRRSSQTSNEHAPRIRTRSDWLKSSLEVGK